MEMDTLLNSAPLYVDKMGLTCDPFAEQAVPLDLIYRSTPRAHQLNFLQHLCQFSQYILVVVGPEGSGKTTLKRLFMHEAQSQLRICDIRAQEVHSVPALLQIIAERFDLPWDPQGGNLEQAVAETLTQDWRPWVIVVDDAESLRADVLEALLKLLRSHTVRGEALHLVLFGQPGVQNLLNLPPIADLSADALHRLDLEMLDETELKAYIQFSLQKAGYAGDYLISETELMDIQDTAKGVYSETNRVIRQQLMFSTRKGPSGKLNLGQVSAKAPITWLAGLAVLGLGVYMAGDNIQSFLVAEKSDVQTQSVNLNPEMIQPQNAPSAEVAQAAPSETVIPIETEVAEPTPVVVSEVPAVAPHMAELVVPVEEKPAATNSTSENIDAALMPETSLPILSLNDDVPAKPVALPSVVAEAAAPVNQEAVTATPVAATPKKEKPTAQKAAPKKIEKTLLAKRSNREITLQLMGLSDKESVNKLFAHYQDSNLSYYETTRDGKPWFVVTYGRYSDMKKAKLAALHLPEGLRQGLPWARSIASIEQEKQK